MREERFSDSMKTKTNSDNGTSETQTAEHSDDNIQFISCAFCGQEAAGQRVSVCRVEFVEKKLLRDATDALLFEQKRRHKQES